MTTSDTQPAAPARALTDFAYADLGHELTTTRRHLERVPDDRLDWRPHEKSKTLGELATHLAQSPGYTLAVAAQDEYDFATAPKQPAVLPSREAMLATFDELTAMAQRAVADLDDEALARPWTLRAGDHVVIRNARGQVLRTLGISHLLHHRAQLGVYLRLCGVAVPATYGPSADE